MTAQIDSLESLRSKLSYSPETGEFTWLITAGKARRGERAGYVGTQGYRLIGFGKKVTTCARLAWFFVHGEWPKHEIVRLNEDKLDDRIANLTLRIHSRNLPPLTQARLLELMIYDPESGMFSRRTRTRGVRSKTVEAGWIKTEGYVMVTVEGRPYRAHRLAWLYVHGRWPSHHIDHINGDPTDNRLCNLREATVAQNMANSKRPRTNTSGYKGVQWHKARKRWVAHIRVNGRTAYLGLFDTPEAAHAAYCEAARAAKGKFARTE